MTSYITISIHSFRKEVFFRSSPNIQINMDTRTSLALIEVMSPTSQPAGLYSQNKITHFLSLFVMVNTLLQGFYDSLFAQKHGLQLEDNTYALIMQIVQTACSVFLGFVLDQLQFTLNVLSILVAFSILTNFFFIFYIVKQFYGDQYVFLYMSLGFQVVSHLGQLIFSATTIAKINNFEDVAGKIKLLLTYLFVGKILKFPISLLVMDRLFYICISALIMAIFIAELLLSRILFVHIKYYCQLKHKILETNSDSFYESLKKVIQCPNFLITLTGALSLSVSTTFLNQQFYYAQLFFPTDDKKAFYIFTEMFICLPYVFVLIGLAFLQMNYARYFFKLQQSSVFSLAGFILIIILFYSKDRCCLMGLVIYVIVLAMLMKSIVGRQLKLGSRSYFAVLVFPAENDKLIPNLGFIYGVFFMLLNFLASITIGNWVIEGGVVRQQISSIYISIAFAFFSLVVSTFNLWVLEFRRGRFLLKLDSLRQLSEEINPKRPYINIEFQTQSSLFTLE